MHFIANNLKTYWIGINIFMVAMMVIIGGVTRITDSGLSMTEWNLISGILPPLNSNDSNSLFNKYKLTPEFTFKNYDMTLTDFKFIFFWEYFHRVWGRLIGLTFFLPLVFFWIKKNLVLVKKNFLLFLLALVYSKLLWAGLW